MDNDALRMDAYYYQFDPTGVPEIDLILCAVATAGKAYHHTDQWSEECAPLGEPLSGETPTAWIQNAAIDAATAWNRRSPPPAAGEAKFQMDQRVRKTKGSSWQGRVVGFYSTKLTPIGYAIESEREPGSVQIYPENALEPAGEKP